MWRTLLFLTVLPACFNINDAPDAGEDAAGAQIDFGGDMASVVDPPKCAAGTICEQQVSSAPLRGVWAISASEAWAVGESATVLHYVAGAWAPSQNPATENLYGIWASAADNVWVVGGKGRIIRWDGTAWTNLQSNITSALRGVFGTSKSDVWVVGDSPILGASGVLLHWDGNSLSQVNGLPTVNFNAVWAKPGQAYVAGDNGILLQQQGANWPGLNTKTNMSLRTLWGTDGGGLLAAGDSGTVLYYDGTAVRSVTASASTWLGLTSKPGSGSSGLLLVGDVNVAQIASPWMATSQLATGTGVVLAAASGSGKNAWVAGSKGSAGFLGYVTP
jgi:hypothetical protein